ncbi:MAG: glucose-1-phosphate thymidylyltransferase RfbA [Rickettsiales bacterium]|nr:glucose-1-phosphate thymidylyltransferase RfbA [Rickettsiales bacterium]
MKGIILAGGSGTRLQPMTNAISKQILPVYDKPMIHYPLAILMNFGIKEILIISTPRDLPIIENFLGSGSQYGVKFSYKVQEKPEGIAQAFLIAEDFINGDSSCLILGDNIFYGSEILGNEISADFQNALNIKKGASVMAYRVSDPQRYGVVELDKNNKAISIEEKPKQPKSNWAVTGLYFYDKNVVEIAKNLKPSARGELEITDVNKAYMEKGELNVISVGKGFAWLDAGTPDSLLDSANFIQTIEKRQGIKIACLEEIAFRKKFISKNQFEELIGNYSKSSDYHLYLSDVLNEI